MLNKKFFFILSLAAFLGGAGESYAFQEETIEVVASETNEGRRRDEKKKYLSEIERGEKRYVGDALDDDIDDRRRRGVEKRYVGEESDEEFFEREKKALYKYDSVEEVTNFEEIRDARLAVEESPEKMEELKEEIKEREKIDVIDVIDD